MIKITIIILFNLKKYFYSLIELKNLKKKEKKSQ